MDTGIHDSAVWRAVSAEDQNSGVGASELMRSTAIAPGEVQTLALNPVFDLLRGTASSQREDEAYQTLGLMGITGMARLMRGLSNSGNRSGFRRAADLTDSVLQPDEEAQYTRRPPYAFGLEVKY